MRTLLITPMLPIASASEMGGVHRRIGAFLRALHMMGSTVDMLQIVPEAMLASGRDAATFDASQSELWGVPVHVSLTPRRTRRQTTWNYYAAGVFDPCQQPRLFPYGGPAVGSSVARFLDDRRPDLVLLDRLDAALALLDSGRRPANVLFDMDDVYHKVQWRSAVRSRHRMGSVAGILQLPALAWAERRASRFCRRTFVCSETDRRHLLQLGFPDNVTFVPNAVRVPAKVPGVVRDRTVLFLGSFHHPPNIMAAERLVRQVFPMIRAGVPDATLLIAGADSEALPSFGTGTPGVEYLGFVEDLNALYRRSRLVCCPITTGSGTRLKLVEAAAYARPMVSTRIGAEGLAFRDGHEILLRDDDQALARACVDLLGDDDLCLRLGAAGHELMRHTYDVAAVERQIVGIVSDVMAAPA